MRHPIFSKAIERKTHTHWLATSGHLYVSSINGFNCVNEVLRGERHFWMYSTHVVL